MHDAESETILVGRIGAPYGIKGWVKIRSYTQPAENLFSYESYKVRRGEQWEPIVFAAGKVHGKGLIAQLAGVEDRTAAERFKGLEVAVAIAELAELAEDEYYWHQLEGLQVFVGDQLLGRVDHLLETGANDVLVVQACEGSIDQRERLIPWLRDEVVKRVDVAGNRIDVVWDVEF